MVMPASMLEEPSRGIEQHDVRARAARLRRQEQRVLGLLGGQGADVAAGPQSVDQHVVRQHVELAYRLALHVVLAGEPEDVDQPGAVDLAGDARRRRGQGGEQAGQVPVLGAAPKRPSRARQEIH